MSIDHIKKQAKRLVHLLPEHLAKHQNNFSLSACQELVAQAHGYASFHAAASKDKKGVNEDPDLLAGIPAAKEGETPQGPNTQQIHSEVPLPNGITVYTSADEQIQRQGRHWVHDIGFDQNAQQTSHFRARKDSAPL